MLLDLLVAFISAGFAALYLLAYLKQPTVEILCALFKLQELLVQHDVHSLECFACTGDLLSSLLLLLIDVIMCSFTSSAVHLSCTMPVVQLSVNCLSGAASCSACCVLRSMCAALHT